MGRLPSLPISDLAFDPTDPTIMYAVAGESSYTRTGNGLYKTTNGGRTWGRLGPEIPLDTVAVCPTDPLLIYTGGAGLRKSTDGGSTWTEIFPGAVRTVVFHPTTPNTIFVGCGGACDGTANNQGIRKSTNGGATWTNALFGYGYASILFHPTDPSIMYASGGQVYASTDGGDHWTAASTGLSVYFPGTGHRSEYADNALRRRRVRRPLQDDGQRGPLGGQSRRSVATRLP